MQTRTYQRASRAALLDEITAATGRSPLAFVVSPGDTTTIDFPDDLDPATIDAVVAAHNAAALDAAQQVLNQQFAADRALLKAFQANASPIAAQVIAAVKAQTRMLARLALADN